MKLTKSKMLKYIKSLIGAWRIVDGENVIKVLEAMYVYIEREFDDE